MRRKKGNYRIVFSIAVLVIIAAVLYIFNSEDFEKNPPKITLDSNGYWNLRTPLKITIEDSSGLLFYKVSLREGDQLYDLSVDHLSVPKEHIVYEVKAPKGLLRSKSDTIELSVEARDGSNWDFFSGNKVEKSFKLVLDKKRPRINAIANSYAIIKGGSALVVFEAEDENLDECYIETNFGKKFKAVPFVKEGFYVSIVAWPVMQQHFKATIVSTDKAGNSAKSYVPFFLKDKHYKVSKITLSEAFLKGKIAQLAEEFPQTQGVTNSLEQFKIINEQVRAENEKLIHSIASKVPEQEIKNFSLKPFYPLRNGKNVASFGDHRLYFFDGTQVSESYHLGLDLASVKMAPIYASNAGDVVFAGYNGIYGNMPMLYHGLGLYTLYGHCSSVGVHEGDHVHRGEHFANTGTSGYAMGDHLHFGVLVQGIEVRPEEWMDQKWMKLNIFDIMKQAKKIIERR